tara:strand:- start:976 stop:1089 length:114 start_codon:yes stop_codon:yes gene_type:complete
MSTAARRADIAAIALVTVSGAYLLIRAFIPFLLELFV